MAVKEKGMGALSDVEEEGSVLLLDEMSEFLGTWHEELEKAGIAVLVARNWREAAKLLRAHAIGLIVVHVRSSLELDVPLRDQPFPDALRPPIVLVTADFSAERVLHLASKGDLVLPSPLKPGTLLKAFRLLNQERDAVARFADAYKLSPRERELVRHALSGLNNDEAAAAFGCSRATISTFWNRIFRKTG
jgi:DNA-binding CsgD family transcriptional regulator